MNDWKDIQKHLGDLVVDGDPGPRTAASVADALGLDVIYSPLASVVWKAVQRHLKIQDDGIPGEQTRGAVIRALSRIAPGDLTSETQLDPYGLARTYLGTKEVPGVKDNPVILRWLRRLASWISHDETAWCSAFVAAMATATGRESSEKLNARSWLDVGEVIPFAQARPGDVVIFWRGSLTAWTGHVAFFEHYNKVRQIVYVLGGNQGNEVNISGYPRSRVLGVRRLRNVDGNSKRII